MTNPFFSGRIPPSLMRQIEELIKVTGKSKTQALIEALTAYVGMPLEINGEGKISGIEERLSIVESRIDALECSANKQADMAISDAGEWLTTGEAYITAQQRGYEKSRATFRRSLNSGVVPNELEGIGLIADFDAKEQANPKDNSVKWLRYESNKK